MWLQRRLRLTGRRVGGAALLAVAGTLVIPGLALPAAAATVTVQWGQTLTQIAAELHTTVAALVAANHIADPNYVRAGSVLQVPAPAAVARPASIVIGRGDTLTAIAARYGTTVAALVALNGLANPDHVEAGARLRLPAGGGGGGGGDMALASYQLPTGGLPTMLAAHPERLVLRPAFVSAAARYGVPTALLEALCWWESGWQASVVSPTGAIGVCQVEPSTVSFVDQVLVHGVLDPHVGSENIDIGAAFLGSLLRATGGNIDEAVAAYYQGLASVRARGMYKSTATYVRGIEAYAAIFAS